MNDRDYATSLSAHENAHEAKPDAFLKFWTVDGAPACRVDLTDICEPWLDALKPEIIPLYRLVSPPDVGGFLKELRGLLGEVSNWLGMEIWTDLPDRPSPRDKALADRAEALLSQVVAHGHELEADRRDLAALLKAAHEVVDADDPASLSEAMPALQAATLPYQDRVDLFTGPSGSCDCRGGEHADDCPFLPENESERLLDQKLVIPASSSTNAEDLEDDLAEVICDSIDGPDWNSSHAAKAVVDYLTARKHPVTSLGTITPAVALHRLSISARNAEARKHMGDVQAIRDAMRVIGELQSRVTRLDPDGTAIRACQSTTHRIVGTRESLPLDGQ